MDRGTEKMTAVLRLSIQAIFSYLYRNCLPTDMTLSEHSRLYLRNIRKSFGSHEVLDIPEWSIADGIYWIQGENGAGKSTLFSIIAGMQPFSGDILLDGTSDIRKQPVGYRLRVSLGEAEPLYPSFLTPGDLIRFTARTRRSPAGQAEALTDRLGITGYLEQPVGACSSGMVKKLSLTLAFLGDPRLIILDEPLITIDREAQENLFGLVKEYRERSVTFLVSSHQMFESNAIGLTQTFLLRNKTLIPAGAL